jgi:hypothetical protein
MNGHIYDVQSSGKTNQFDKTTKDPANFIGSSMLFKDSGGAVRKAMGQLEHYVIPMPAALDAAVTNALEIRIHELEFFEAIKELRAYARGVTSLFSVMLGQCTDCIQRHCS